MGGGLFPTFTQFTVYKTNTHIYSQAIHVPDGGRGISAPGDSSETEPERASDTIGHSLSFPDFESAEFGGRVEPWLTRSIPLYNGRLMANLGPSRVDSHRLETTPIHSRA